MWDLITLAQFLGSEMSLGLFQGYGWVYKTLRLSSLVVDHSVMVTSARLNSVDSQFLISVL